MVVSEDIHKDYLARIVSGELDVDKLIVKLETGIEHIEDDKYKIDGRWEIIYKPNRDIVLVSEDFMKEVVAATYSVTEEWGGLIFGRIKHMKDNCTIFILERTAIMAQNRTGASFEIRDEDYHTWCLSSQFMEFVGSGFKRIGWVHSHVNMGVFWSGTDDNTIKQLIAEEANSEIISLVVSKRSDKTLETAYRPSKRGVSNGIEFLIPDVRKSIDIEQIFYEAPMLSYDDLDEEYREEMKKKMDETDVIEAAVTTTQTETYSWGSWGSGYASAGTTVTGRDIDVYTFILAISSYNTKVRKFLDENLEGKKWKMKSVVKGLVDKKMSDELVQMLDFYLKTPNRVQQYLLQYKNFNDISEGFLKNIKGLCRASKKFDKFMTKRYGQAWAASFNAALEKKSYSTTSSSTTTKWTPSEVRKEETGWDDFIKTVDDKLLRKSIRAIIDIDGPMIHGIVKKATEHIEWRVRGEEEQWPAYLANVYQELKEIEKKIRKKDDREEYRKFVIRFLGAAFKPFRSTTDSKKKNALQMVVNMLPDELLLDFLYDFVVEYESVEQLDQLYAEGKIPVREKLFGCPICRNWWKKKEDAQKCRENCEKIEKKKAAKASSTKLETAKRVDTTPKAQSVAPAEVTYQTTLAPTKSGGGGTTSSKYGDRYICGMSPRYWEAENVCMCCGTEWDTRENAEQCYERCEMTDVDAAMMVIDSGIYTYTCPQCMEIMIDEFEMMTHSGAGCNGYGSSLHSRLRLFMMEFDEHWQPNGRTFPQFPEHKHEDFNDWVDTYWGGEVDEQKKYPPIIRWIKHKLGTGVSLFNCRHCGVDYSNAQDQLFSLYDCYSHEVFCKGEEEAKREESLRHETAEDYFREESFYAEFTKLKDRTNTYRCDMCGTHMILHSPEMMKDFLVLHYVNNHNGNEDMALILHDESGEAPFLEGKVNLEFKHGRYFCQHCHNSTYTSFTDVAGLANHMWTKHQIVLKELEVAIQFDKQAEEWIADKYNDWLEKRFESKIPLNQCMHCGQLCTTEKKMEDNAKLIQRHEYFCPEQFKK